jgi:hypothetical protein
MSRVRRTVESALGYALFVAAAAGVIAWNTREKCLAGIGVLPDIGLACPRTKTLVVAVAILSIVIFVVAVVRSSRKNRDTATQMEGPRR